MTEDMTEISNQLTDSYYMEYFEMVAEKAGWKLVGIRRDTSPDNLHVKTKLSYEVAKLDFDIAYTALNI